jgi:hypothetical protein
MEDVLKIYEKPLSEHQPVVCVDEKPVVLHEETRPPIPMQPGQVGRRDYEYKRCGTANVFCGIEPKVGVHFTKVTPTRSSPAPTPLCPHPRENAREIAIRIFIRLVFV